VSEKEQALPDAPVYEIQGRRVKLPVEVRDASSGNAMYQVDAAAAQALIPGDAFQVVESAPGQTQLLLGVIDYRDNDLGDYNEVAIIFFVHPRGGSAEQAGTYIYKLPVNQSFTCDAGCTIWGFPKTVDTIDYSYDDAKATCRLEMDGQHVFTLSLPRGSAAGGAAGDTAGPTYTYINGVPHRTTFTTGGDTVVSPGDDGIELSLGSHPIADELRGLGLPKPALMSTWNEHMRGTFEVPEKLA
jgi:hypothetical protein